MKNQKMLFSLALTLSVSIASGQLTTDQKAADFMQLAGLYAKNYAPYEWKRDVMGFDLYNIRPWLDRVKASKDDLEFYDICVRYVASLKDSHGGFQMQSDFIAYLPFDLDIYDGKVLIDRVYRSVLPRSSFPIDPGDELVTVDGRTSIDLVNDFVPYIGSGGGNESARRRLAARAFSHREQLFDPRAPEAREGATIVVRNASGAQTTYLVPWMRKGTPVWSAGMVPSPGLADKFSPQRAARGRDLQLEGPEIDTVPGGNPWGVWTGEPRIASTAALPPYLKMLRELQAGVAMAGLVALGRAMPVFDPPSGFRMRLGAKQEDPFLSGTIPLGTHRVGFIRLPNMGDAYSPAAPPQLEQEIGFLQANTDALVLDLMHNGGGSNCYAENAAQYLSAKPFRGVVSRLRANQYWHYSYSRGLADAIASDAPASLIALYSGFVAQIQAALSENRALTAPLPICTGEYEAVQPAQDEDGNLLSYTKPILVLVDEFTASSAETLAMILQDEGRATILGVRTNGAGGNPQWFNAGAYSEGFTSVTTSMVTRKKPVSTPGFPKVDHYENAGIYPDVVVDYMTRENLVNGGRAFVQAFTQTVTDLIARR